MYGELEKVPVPSLLLPSYYLHVVVGVQLFGSGESLTHRIIGVFLLFFPNFLDEFYLYWTTCFGFLLHKETNLLFF